VARVRDEGERTAEGTGHPGLGGADDGAGRGLQNDSVEENRGEMKIRQYHIGSWLGALRSQAASAQFYVSIIQLGLVAVAAIRTIQEWFPWLTFPMLVILLGGLYLAAMVFDYVLVFPSVVSFGASQAYKHPNPMADDIRTIKEELRALRAEIEGRG
jgi:hypothetical protein